MTDRATDTECLSKRLTVDVPTAARLLGVSRNTLYEAIRLREFPAIRVGRRILVPTSHLLNLAGKPDATPAYERRGQESDGKAYGEPR